jgi:hypothetical protein
VWKLWRGNTGVTCRFGWRDAALTVYPSQPCIPPISRRDQRRASAAPCPISIIEILASEAVRRDWIARHPAQWLADPCTMALHEHIEEERRTETVKARAYRLARYKAKQALAEEAAAAKKQRRAKW